MIEAAHWDAGLDVPHRQAPQADLRGRQAQRARRRPDDLPRPRPTASSSCSTTYGGGTVAPGVTVVGTPAGAARRSRSPTTCPARIAGTADRRGDHGRRRSRAVGCDGRPATTTLTVDPAAVAPRPRPTPTTWSRRSSGSSATTRCRRCCPTPPAGRGLTREQRLRRRIGRTLAGAGLRRGGELPVRRRRRPSTPLGLPGRRPAPARRPARQPALDEEPPLYTTTLLPGLLESAGPQPRPRCDRASRSSRPARSPSRSTAGPAPVYGVEWRPDRRRAGQAARGPARAAAVPGRRPRRRARARRLVGSGPRPPTGPTPSSWSALSADELGVEVERRAGRADAVAPGPLCAGAASAARSSATPASCTRGSAQALRPAARARPRSRSTSTS